MSVSSVSSSSVLWEEYLERQRKAAQNAQTSESASQSNAGNTTSFRSALAPVEDLLAELQGLREDPEALKARAAEMAEEVKSSASAYSGRGGEIAQSLASDLETVASTGDLSVMTEKLERRAGGARGGFGMPAHLPQLEEDSEDDDPESAADSSKAIIAQLQELLSNMEEDESDASSSLTPESILTELQELSGEPDALSARAAEIASALRESSGGSGSLFLEELASDLEEVASSGDLTPLREKVEEGAGRFARRSAVSAESGASAENSSEPASLESLFAKFRKLKEENGAATETDGQSSIDELLSAIAGNLRDRLASSYSSEQSLYSSVSLSG